jgi:hypothetical protein
VLGAIGGNQILEIEEPVQVEVSPRIAPADGSTAVDVVVTPTGPDGAPLGPGRAVAIESTSGTWDGPVVDRGDGTYARRLIAPASPALAAIATTIDGIPLAAWPRVDFQ